MILRIAIAGLVALALVALSYQGARAGSIHSPITKAQAKEARIVLYEHEVALRDADPTAFDHKHALLGRILSSQAGYARFVAANPFHHGLLCEHDPFIWRVVEGDMLYHKLHPFINPPPEPTGGPSVLTDFVPGGDPPGGGPGPGRPGHNFQISSVPEPSSWVLMVSSAILVLAVGARRRKMVGI